MACWFLTTRSFFSSSCAEGLSEGAGQKAVENAKNLPIMNVLPPEKIAEAIGLSVEGVKGLRNLLGAVGFAPELMTKSLN
ncbi:MAG: hypothetical protein II921_10090 [Treponema sp.]|nr:hypothetical protein [Treponema sp.]